MTLIFGSHVILIAEAIQYYTVAAAYSVIGLALQLFLKMAAHIYMNSEMSNYGQKLADGYF